MHLSGPDGSDSQDIRVDSEAQGLCTDTMLTKEAAFVWDTKRSSMIIIQSR